MRPSDDQLLEAIRAGSRTAWGDLFSRHADAAWRTAFAIVRDHARAEDVVQDAFVRAIRAAERFDRQPAVPALAAAHRHEPRTRRAAPRAVRDARRRRARRRDRDADDDPADIRGAIARLDPDRRVVVVLRYWLDLSPTEIADRLGVPVGTVGSRLARALDDLGADLEVTGNA